MAKAKLDETFREELLQIERSFASLSDPERTTALYTLLQYANPVQIRFFLNVLTQMAEQNPIPTAPANMNGNASMATLGAIKRNSNNSGTTPGQSPAVSPRTNPIASPIQRTDSDYDSSSRSRRPLYDRHSAPQDGSLGIGLLSFQTSVNTSHNRMNNMSVPTDATDYSNITGDYGDRRISNTSSTSSRAHSPSLRPRTPEYAQGAVGDWSPNERSSSLKRSGMVSSAGLGIVGDSIIPNNQPHTKLSNGYRLADMPIIAPRGSSLVNDEASVIASELGVSALSPPTSLLASTPTPKPGHPANVSGTSVFSTPRSSAANSRPITPMGIRSPASAASIGHTPTSQRSNVSPPHDLMNLSPPHILSQSGGKASAHQNLLAQSSHSSLHSVSQMQAAMPPQMHPGAGWGHIDLAKTRGSSAYAISDYSDNDQEGLDGVLIGGVGGVGGLGSEHYGEGGPKGRVRTGSIGSGSGHKEKGKIPESLDLELLNGMWLACSKTTRCYGAFLAALSIMYFAT